MKKYHYLNTQTLSIPFSIPLTKETSWESIDKRKTQFFIARFHFFIRERVINSKTKMGPPVSVFSFPKGMEYKKMTALEFEYEELQHQESLKKSLIESEHLQEFANNLLKVSLKAGLFKLDSGSDLKFTNTFREVFSNEFRMNQTVRETKKVKIEDEIIFGKDYEEKTYLVPEYQKYAYDIWLGYVDYLYVIYDKSMFGLRKKRKKYPVWDRNDRRPNVIKLNDPVATIEFWRKVGGYSYYKESDYKEEVKDTNSFSVKTPENNFQHVISFPKVASLYQVSQVAFPLKWIKREGEWTEEELMKIEVEEAKNTAWWYEHGPGSKERI